MGMGNRRRVWSSFGGTWHRVRVSYPRLWWRYGRTGVQVTIRGVLAAVVGFALVRLWRNLVAQAAAVDWVENNPLRPVVTLVQTIGLLVGVGLLAYGLYLLARAIIDAATPASFNGQVLWKQVWRKNSGGEDRPAVPWLYYLALDDGRGDRTRAWALPAAYSDRCDTGDTIAVHARRWSRTVLSVSVVERGTSGHAVSIDDADARHEDLVAALMTPLARATRIDAAPGALLTADQVSRVLGVEVVVESAVGLGPMSATSYRTADRKRVVLMVQVTEGTIGSMAWQANARGQQVPGVGDGAYVSGDRGVARLGPATIVLTLLRAGKGRGDRLPDLLRLCVAGLTGPPQLERHQIE